MERDKTLGSPSDPPKTYEAHYLPELEQTKPADEGTTTAYFRRLQAQWIRGEKAAGEMLSEAYPLRFAPQLSGDRLPTAYPIYFDSDMANFAPFYPTLEQSLLEQFDEVSAGIIREELPKIFAAVINKRTRTRLVAQELVTEIGEALLTIDLPQEDTARKIDAVRSELLQRVTLLFDLRGSTAFHLLSLQNQLNSPYRLAFLQNLKRVATGLQELLELHDGSAKLSMGQLDFAEELMSLDKIGEVTVAKVSSHFPPERLIRLRSALKTVAAAQKSFAAHSMTIFTSEELADTFKLDNIFDEALLQAVPGAVQRVQIHAEERIQEFVKIIAALRTGELMIDQQYDDELHNAYFDQFSLRNLSKDDLRSFPPIVLIANSSDLAKQTNDFLGLLTNDSLVKILGINLLNDLVVLSDSNELELATLAIFRRSSFVFQGGMDAPLRLNEAYRAGLVFPGSVFWNILLPRKEVRSYSHNYATLSAASESRYFPYLTYEPQGNHFARQHLDLQDNVAPEEASAIYEQAVKSTTGTTLETYSLSPADFLAMYPHWQSQLAIIPSNYQSADLLPLLEYLQQARTTLHRKLPFIWLVDDENKLQRALVPVSWIKTCRERLEYWGFLQTLAGSKREQQTEEQLKTELEQEKQAEITRLQTTLEEQFAQVRNRDLQQAIVRMLNGLLNNGTELETALTQMSTTEYPDTTKSTSVPIVASDDVEVEKQIREEPAPLPISDKAWVESEECTSCRDCVDALPTVFKYNDNKQAYVHDPKGGTFAKIVATAEKCPARCIHPGIPQNQSEPELDKWIKRAEKYN